MKKCSSLHDGCWFSGWATSDGRLTLSHRLRDRDTTMSWSSVNKRWEQRNSHTAACRNTWARMPRTFGPRQNSGLFSWEDNVFALGTEHVTTWPAKQHVKLLLFFFVAFTFEVIFIYFFQLLSKLKGEEKASCIFSKLWPNSWKNIPLAFPGWFGLWHHWRPLDGAWVSAENGTMARGKKKKKKPAVCVGGKMPHAHPPSFSDRLFSSAAVGCWNEAGKAVGRRITEAVTRGDGAKRTWSNLVTQITGRAARQWVR